MAKSPYPIDADRTAIAIGYRNKALIADQVLPRVPVAKEEFTWMEYPVAEGFTLPDTLIGRTSRPNEANLSGVEQTSSTRDYGLEIPVPQKDIDNADSRYDPVDRATMRISDWIATGREVRTANLVFNAASHANKITLAGPSQFSDFANSDPLGVLLAGLDSCLVRPNVGVLGNAAWTKLRQHPKVVKAVLGNAGDSGVASRQAVAELLELDEILVGQGWLNTAKPGQAPVMTRIWGKHVAMIHRNPVASTDGEVTFGLTAEFGGRVARSEFDSKIGLRGGTRLVVGESVRELVVASQASYFVENAVA